MDGFEAGARAVLDYIAQEWPDLAEPGDFPTTADHIADHIASIAGLLRQTSDA